jgi:hypothetical protein
VVIPPVPTPPVPELPPLPLPPVPDAPPAADAPPLPPGGDEPPLEQATAKQKVKPSETTPAHGRKRSMRHA